jgi:hypothetical protein
MTISLTALVLATAAAAAATEALPDKANLDRTQIIGNRELPKVTIIVPWKKPLPGALQGKPVASVLDEALSPLDRDVLRRQIGFEAQRRATLNPPSPASPEKTP